MKKIFLTTEELSMLQTVCERTKFSHDFDFVYERQVPNSSVALLSGEIQVLKKKQILETVAPGTLLGAYNLLNNRPIECTCKVLRESEVILINRTDIIDALENQKSALGWLLDKIKASSQSKI